MMGEMPCSVTKFLVFQAYGQKLKTEFEWLGQNECKDVPPYASALTLGESSVMKFGISFPIRTGLNTSKSFQGSTKSLPNVTFLPLLKNNEEDDSETVEEIYVSDGVCSVSIGPMGGPSKLKGLYRPLSSYGTGVGISQVVKAKFTRPAFGFIKSSKSESETFICLAESGGISIYAEDSSETHVSHVPEFHIEKILPCKFGLLVIPSKDKTLEKDIVTEYSKGLYILTHPIKQVSKVWLKNRQNLDYVEYDSAEERLMWCEEDICIFWSLKNDKIFIRRLVELEKNEIQHLSMFHPNSHQTGPEASKQRHPSGTPGGNVSQTSSPFPSHKYPYTRSAALRANREAAAAATVPSGVTKGRQQTPATGTALSPFPFVQIGGGVGIGGTISHTGTSAIGSGSSIGHGFYPPHICVFDDPEIALTTLFQLELPKSQCKEPVKFKYLHSRTHSKMSLFFLLKNTLYSHGIDAGSGLRLGNWSIKNTIDFEVPQKSQTAFCKPSTVMTTTVTSPTVVMIAVLYTNGRLGVCWLDENFSLVCENVVQLHEEIGFNIKSVEGILYGDTILSSIQAYGGNDIEESMNQLSSENRKDDVKFPEYLKIQVGNWKHNYFLRTCIENWNLIFTFDDRLMTKITAMVSCSGIGGDNKNLGNALAKVLQNVIISEGRKNAKIETGRELLKSVATIIENVSIYKYGHMLRTYLNALENDLINFLSAEFPNESFKGGKDATLQIFPSFSSVLKGILKGNFSAHQEDIEVLPEVLQILLKSFADNSQNFEQLISLDKEKKFIPLIQLLIQDVYYRNLERMKFSSPVSCLEATGRFDLLSGREIIKCQRNNWIKEEKQELQQNYFANANDDQSEVLPWMKPVLAIKVFREDRRIEEVCRLLDSTSSVPVETEQRAEMSDHDVLDEQEKLLVQMLQLRFGVTVGRAALTFRTGDSAYTSLTSSVNIPPLTVIGKCKAKGTSVELSDTDLPVAFSNWPSYHNAVAAACSIRFTEPPPDAWFAFSKAKVAEGPEQAGMLLGFGLNRILSGMPPLLRHEFISKENSFSTMSMLLGLAANFKGTGDLSTWKLISLHIGAMLPACTTELEMPRLATLVAPAALGLLFMGTQNSYIAKILLGEMSKKFTPLSCFGPGNTTNNTTSALVNYLENQVGNPTDREAHSLCAGFGLGFVSLAKGNSRSSANGDDSIDGILRRFVVGGPKPIQIQKEEELPFSSQAHNEPTIPSLWEEYRCCHIEEGDNVNIDVTTPSAIVAVSLIYLRSGNEAVMNWLAPPTTLHLLDGVRPDILMLRSLASILVFKEVNNPTVSWLEATLLPKPLTDNAFKESESTKHSYSSINQCWASIVVGFCLGLGIRFAGTSDQTVMTSIHYYIDRLLLILESKGPTTLEKSFPKNFIDSCICNLILSGSLVVAGSGDLKLLQLGRWMQKKVISSTTSMLISSYGLELCIGMSIGILFLGGGRCSLSNDDSSIGLILASVYPKWPINASDNRYHLQALRHLYILAAQPRLLLPKIPFDSATNYRSKDISFKVKFLNGKVSVHKAPLLLPPFYLIKQIELDHPEYFRILFELPEDLPYLRKIVENNGIINLVAKPIRSACFGFVREMSWKSENKFHPLFDDYGLPEGEKKIIATLKYASEFGEWNGIKQTTSVFLSLLDHITKLDVEILQSWLELNRANSYPTLFPTDVISILELKLSVQ